MMMIFLVGLLTCGGEGGYYDYFLGSMGWNVMIFMDICYGVGRNGYSVPLIS